MRTARRIATVASVWVLAASSAFAHPGHGKDGGDFGILHYLTEPEHLLVAIPIVLIVAVGAAYATGLIRPKARRRS